MKPRGTAIEHGESIDATEISGRATVIARPKSRGQGLNLLFNDVPTPVQLRIGDDIGSAPIPLRGTLVYP